MILIATEQMASCGVPESFFHIIGRYIFSTHLNVPLLISSIVDLVLIFLQMFKLRIFSMLDN